MTPHILHEGKYTKQQLDVFLAKYRGVILTDIYELQMRELYEILHPDKSADLAGADLESFIKEHTGERAVAGSWVYLPLTNALLHLVSEQDYFKLRTNRNKNLITQEEQEKLKDFTIGIIGLSIGSAMATACMQSGISIHMKIADFDTLSTTNLNRIRSGVSSIGKLKTDITAAALYEINPFAKLDIFTKGLHQETLVDLFSGTPLNLIFEAIDDFEMKIRIRLMAKEKKVSVVMLTNLGDRILVDIERYDLDPSTPIFNGLLGALPEEILSQPITNEMKQKYAISIVGRENVPDRALESVREIGKTLVGRPQLMSTVTMAGGLAAYIARKIALGEHAKSGRFVILIDNLLS